jgi:27-O-demethylrifamycin SV methyltransferase
MIMGQEFHYGYFDRPGITLEQATAALTEQMLARASIAGGDRVLDVGCGTGRQACDLASSADAHVLGISTSATGVAAARELAERRVVSGARFEQRDGARNGLEAESFDVLWVLESSHPMRDRKALLDECVRVLVPGGRLVLCDLIRKREIPFVELRARRQEFATLRAAFGDAHMEPLESYTSALQEVGMEIADAVDISEQTYPTLAAWRSNVGLHDAVLRELLSGQEVDGFVEATRILESLWNDGTLGYGILSGVKGP